MTDDNQKIIASFLGKIKGVRPRLGGIYLFGSRARGNARPDSDYDFLIVVPKKDAGVRDELYNAAVDVLLENGADLSLKVINQVEFDRMRKISAPFILNVLKEGINVGQ